MPNWVYNSLTIEDTPDVVNVIKEQLNKPFSYIHDTWDNETKDFGKKETFYSAPVFAFWNIIKPDNLEEYHTTSDGTQLANPLNWYNWNNAHWGTKWDVARADGREYDDTELQDEVENGDNLVLVYRFNTAWSPPIPALLELSRQYPKTLLNLEWEEEQGFGGEVEFLHGDIISQFDYESKCMDCGLVDCLEYCDTCEANICNSCHDMSEVDDTIASECDEHKQYVGVNA